jgi:alanine racemase
VTLTLRVDRLRWRDQVDATANAALAAGPLVPVVKGNGYGFGRAELAEIAADLLASHTGGTAPPLVAVGTVHELAGLPASVRPLVLTPVPPAHATLLELCPVAPTVTISSMFDVAALGGWTGAAVIKLESSMHRLGARPDEVAGIAAAAAAAGLELDGYALHLPLAGDDESRRAEVENWLELLDGTSAVAPEVSLSHVAPATHGQLAAAHPNWTLPLRVGTRLWHGEGKAGLQLVTDVVAVRPVAAGTAAGYHATPAPGSGHLVVVGAGTAHGVRPLDDGRSPFHYQRRRVALLEPPHMHTSTLFVPDGDPVPARGETLDVQRSLISVSVDDLVWE